MERLFATDGARLVSRMIGRVARIPLPQKILTPIIGAYALGMGVDVEEAEAPIGGFRCFGEFFGRQLRPGARPISTDADAMISPCDGAIVGFGETGPGKKTAFHIKDSTYTPDELLGAQKAGNTYEGGGHLVIYLHPRDYHRVHAPAAGTLTRLRHIPGARYPVNDWFQNRVTGILGKNERMVFQIDLPAGGGLSLIMVAAFGVGNIETQYPLGSTFGPAVPRERDFDPAIAMQRGDELGAFLLGSTVVLLWSKGAVTLDQEITKGRIAMGRRLGRIN
ncbi:MAG: archaetidylserine decarboxylase [Myxococcota bacterium]|nr:archaetidylserine decarboxylase [Myxococcota bacterium]